MRQTDCDETNAPVTGPDHIDAFLWDLGPDELPGALRLLNAMERARWISPREAKEWRGRIAALGIFHEDPQLWVDGAEG